MKRIDRLITPYAFLKGRILNYARPLLRTIIKRRWKVFASVPWTFYVAIFHWVLAASHSCEHIKTFSKGRVQERISLHQAEVYNSARRFHYPAALFYITHSRGTFIPLELTMFHKMYLVSSKLFRLTPTNKPYPKIKRKLPQIDYDKWIKMSGKLRDEDVTQKAQL